MEILLIVLACIIGIFILFSLTCIIVAEVLVHPKKKKYQTEINKKYQTEDFILPISKNVEINGWFIKSPKDTKKCFIYCHGYTCKRDTPPFDLLVEDLINDYNIITFEFRAHGFSKGKMSTAGMKELDDLNAVLTYAKEVKGQEKICIFGLSMGANVCLRAGENKNVDVIIVDSPFINLEEYLINNLKVWSHLPSIFTPFILGYFKLKMGKKYERIDAFKSIPNFLDKPLMLIHAKDDKSISFENSTQIYEVRNNKDITELYLPEVGGHCRSYKENTEEYKTKVTNFVRKYL